MNLSDAIDGYLLFKASRASPTTIATDRVVLRQFLEWSGDQDVATIKADCVRQFVKHERQRGLSPFSIRRQHAAISALYSWLCSPEIALASVNPTQGVPPPRLPKLKAKALSQDEIRALFAATDKIREKRRAKALLLFLLDTGCRASEVASLDVSDVNFTSGKVRVVGKRQKERYVYLGKRALSALWLYVKEERPSPARANDDQLFLTFDGYPTTRHTLRGILRRLSAIAGIHAHLHQFRHTAAIEHLRHGMDLVSVQHLLGHESIEVTRGYLEALSDEDVEVRAKRTSPVDNWRL